jgi:hypothetical protein
MTEASELYLLSILTWLEELPNRGDVFFGEKKWAASDKGQKDWDKYHDSEGQH